MPSTQPSTRLVGAAHADQRELRPDPPVQALADYLVFLDEVEAATGLVPREPRSIVGARFLL